MAADPDPNQDLSDVYDMYANTLTKGFEPTCLIVPSDQGPVMIFPDRTGYLLDDNGNPTHKISWEPNPEGWLAERD